MYTYVITHIWEHGTEKVGRQVRKHDKTVGILLCYKQIPKKTKWEWSKNGATMRCKI